MKNNVIGPTTEFNSKKSGKKIKLFNHQTFIDKILSQPIQMVTDILKNRMFFKLDITTSMYGVSFSDEISRIFKYSLTKKIIYNDDEGCLGKTALKTMELLPSSNKITVDFDYTIYKNTPIFIMSNSKNSEEKNKKSDDRCYLFTINTEKHKKNLIMFIHHINCRCAKMTMDANYLPPTHIISKKSGGIEVTHVDHISRSFDDVFIEDDIINEIKESVDKFINQREWYTEHNIPYHLGIILHGQPGSGKSSLAIAIANYINAMMYIIPSGDLNCVEAMFSSSSGIAPINSYVNSPPRCVIVEDIDCCDTTKNRENKNNDISINAGINTNSLATVLNSLDGAAAPSNVIYIFTTNHIENIDPAIIRPGRCDLSFKINNVSVETFKKFINSHYGEHELPDDIDIKDGITFATLQLLVMKGYTYEQILDYVYDNSNLGNISINDVISRYYKRCVL